MHAEDHEIEKGYSLEKLHLLAQEWHHFILLQDLGKLAAFCRIRVGIKREERKRRKKGTKKEKLGG